MKIVKYFLVGGVAAVVDWLLFYILAVRTGTNYFLAGCLSFTLATTVNYFLSITHVFESGARFRRHQEIAAVFAVSCVGLAINQAILLLFVQWVGVHLMLAKISATGVVFLWNYWARARYIFRTANT